MFPTTVQTPNISSISSNSIINYPTNNRPYLNVFEFNNDPIRQNNNFNYNNSPSYNPVIFNNTFSNNNIQSSSSPNPNSINNTPNFNNISSSSPNPNLVTSNNSTFHSRLPPHHRSTQSSLSFVRMCSF
jgi:hypothetical protein